MKKIKAILFTAVTLVGLGSSIGKGQASRPKDGTAYYAVTDDTGSYVWLTTEPSGTLYACVSNNACYCIVKVVAGYLPVNGQCPPADKIISHEPAQHSIFRKVL